MDAFSVLRAGVGTVAESLSFAPLREVAPLVHSFTALAPEALLERCCEEHVEVPDLVRLGQLLAARFLNECLQLQRASSQLRSALEEKTETPEGAELATLRARCQELERELEERPRSSGTADTLDEAEALRAALGAPHCTRCEALEARLRAQEEKILELQLAPEAEALAASPRVKAAVPADPELARLLVGEAPPVVRKRAAVVLQAAWRRRAAAMRFERHLLGLVFPTRNEGRRMSGTVGSVRLSQALVARVYRGLRRRGLDFEAAFRCADTGYVSGEEQPPWRLIRVGQFLLFLCRQQGLALAPAESAALLRLLKRRDRANRRSDPLKPPSGASGDLQEAWRWEMAYDLARQLQVAACSETGLAPAREALVAVAAELNGRHCQFLWGELPVSWERLLRDAALAELLEERQRLQAALEEPSQSRRGPFTGELEAQLADCEAQMDAVLKGPCPSISATALAARLLKEQLPLAPVTLHAAVRAAQADAQGFGQGAQRAAGQIMDHMRQQQDLKGSLLGGFVSFQRPLPASPNLIHISAVQPTWTVRLQELSERAMMLQILPLTGMGWKEDLHIAYSAGSAEGLLRVGPSQVGRSVQAHFIPRLTRVPELVALQSYVRAVEPKPPPQVSGASEPEAATCQLGAFAVAAVAAPGGGLSVRAVRKAERPEKPQKPEGAERAEGPKAVMEEAAARAALGGVTLEFTAAKDELQVKAQWRALEEKPAKSAEVRAARQADFPLASRVKVVRASPRGFASLLHRDAQMLQLWYEASCSEATASVETLQALAPLSLSDSAESDQALRAKGLTALCLEEPGELEPLRVPSESRQSPLSPTSPVRSRGLGGFKSRSGLSLPDSDGASSPLLPRGDADDRRRPLMVVEQPLAPRAKKISERRTGP